MRRLRYSVAMSLDGYIAGPQGEADWIVMDPDIDFAALAAQFDTLLMGRKTFAPMARSAGKGKGGDPFGQMKIVVASRTLDPRAHPNVIVVRENLKETVADLKAKEGKDIWLFGGGALFRTLLEMDLVDTVEVAVIPVLLGEGLKLLPGPSTQTRLRLESHRVYEKTGTVTLAYQVEPQKKRRRKK
jgi:dihydrofolate reductase